MKKAVLIITVLLLCSALWALTPVKSFDENYYEYKVLTGEVQRPYLTYRTIYNSFSENEEELTIYPVEVFSSYNSDVPSGQNDGSLWQGAGFNVSLRGGVTYKKGCFSFTVRPELDWSQNAEYDTYLENYKYFWRSFDLPQRFGDSSFVTVNGGDTEVRFATEHFTLGAGYSALWTGPMYLNSILHSNNAGSYPRADIGIRALEIPYLGKVEAFYSLGILKNSDYAISCPGENSFLHVLTLGYQPSFFEELTLGVHVVDHDLYDKDRILDFFKTLFTHQNDTGVDYSDLKWSLSFDLLFDQAGFEVYGEVAQDDYGLTIFNSYHTVVFQLGMRKSFDFIKNNDVYSQVILEYGNMEMSRDAFTQWTYSFYTHPTYTKANDSYSNLGQLLGAGSGYAGNSQYAEVQIFYPKGMSSVHVQRSNPDNDYVYQQVYTNGRGSNYDYFRAFKGILAVGADTDFFVTDNITVSAGATYEIIKNAHYETGDNVPTTSNIHAEVGFSYRF